MKIKNYKWKACLAITVLFFVLSAVQLHATEKRTNALDYTIKTDSTISKTQISVSSKGKHERNDPIEFVWYLKWFTTSAGALVSIIVCDLLLQNNATINRQPCMRHGLRIGIAGGVDTLLYHSMKGHSSTMRVIAGSFVGSLFGHLSYDLACVLCRRRSRLLNREFRGLWMGGNGIISWKENLNLEMKNFMLFVDTVNPYCLFIIFPFAYMGEDLCQ
ncbi:MAG: hypothetical protein WBQ73_02390 [Candidatus Babeliales bacterium]